MIFLTNKTSRSILLALACFLTFSLPSFLNADDLKIHGLSFGIEDLQDVDSISVKVSVLGKHRLIPRVALEEFVVEQYLRPPALYSTFDLPSLLNFLSETLTVGKPQLSYYALLAILNHKDFKELEFSEFAWAESSKDWPVLLKRALSAKEVFIPRQVLFNLLILIGLDDLTWSVKYGESLMIRSDEDLALVLMDRIKVNFQAQNYTLVLRLLDFGQQFFEIASELPTKFSNIKELMKSLVAALETKDYLVAHESVRGLKKYSELTAAADLLETKIILDSTEVLLKAGEVVGALERVALVNPNKVTPRTFELTRKILLLYEPQETGKLVFSRESAFLVGMSIRDSSLKDIFLQKLNEEGRVLLGLAEGPEANVYMEKAERYLTVLASLRPDPNRENDKFRFSLFEKYMELDQVSNAEAKLKSIKEYSGLTIIQKAIAYGGRLLVWAVILILVALILFGLRFLLGKKLFPSKVLADQKDPGVAGQQEISQEGMLGQVKSLINPLRREYIKCLAEFNLKEGVSLAEIKSAYRGAVKEFHPDLNKDSEYIASQKFIELNRTYERVLELREQLGLLD